MNCIAQLSNMKWSKKSWRITRIFVLIIRVCQLLLPLSIFLLDFFYCYTLTFFSSSLAFFWWSLCINFFLVAIKTKLCHVYSCKTALCYDIRVIRILFCWTTRELFFLCSNVKWLEIQWWTLSNERSSVDHLLWSSNEFSGLWLISCGKNKGKGMKWYWIVYVPVCSRVCCWTCDNCLNRLSQ